MLPLMQRVVAGQPCILTLLFARLALASLAELVFTLLPGL